MSHKKSNKSTLELRRKDFDAMKASPKGESQQRHAIENGGFHRPGSNKK